MSNKRFDKNTAMIKLIVWFKPNSRFAEKYPWGSDTKYSYPNDEHLHRYNQAKVAEVMVTRLVKKHFKGAFNSIFICENANGEAFRMFCFDHKTGQDKEVKDGQFYDF